MGICCDSEDTTLDQPKITVEDVELTKTKSYYSKYRNYIKVENISDVFEIQGYVSIHFKSAICKRTGIPLLIR
jgi:hypothetical protein